MKQLFHLSPLFTNHMVLQRDAYVPIWGTADNGLKIQVEICGQKKAAVCANGQWRVLLAPLPGGGPFPMKISCGEDQRLLEDVMFGDVFIAAGQSNMEFPLQDELHGSTELKKEFPMSIRYYAVPQIEYEDETQRIPNLPEGSWELCSETSAREFSAIAHYFAQGLSRLQPKVPIGIIGCNKGGTSAACWISEASLQCQPELQETYVKPYLEAIEGQSGEAEAAGMAAYESVLQTYQKRLAAYQAEHPEASLNEVKRVVGHTPWPPPFGRKCFLRPSGLYHTMLQKIVPYKAKAVLWYQGEEDTAHCKLYEKLLTCLLQDWRRDFTDLDLPFLIVQLPGYRDDKADKPADSWAIVWDAQRRVVQQIPHTGLVVALDCGEEYNIHPLDKQPVAERLLRLAQQLLYGAVAAGMPPLYREMKQRGDELELRFAFAPGDGFLPGQAVRGVTLADASGSYVPVQAKTEENSVIVCVQDKTAPFSVRYAWANNPQDADLKSRQGLLASPFCTAGEK